MTQVPVDKKGKARMSRIPDGYQIKIPSNKNIFTIGFLSFWLIGWLVGEIFALYEVLNPDKENNFSLFILVWLIGWSIGGFFAMRTLFWAISGKELIQITQSELKVIRKIFSYSRSKEFDLSSISDLRLSRQDDGDSEKEYHRGMIAFDYGKKTYSFASDIEEAEAKYLIKELKKINEHF